MNRAEALTRLRAHEAELRAMGAGAIYLFGSVARDEGEGSSDVDLFIDVDPQFPHFSLIDLSGLKIRLEQLMTLPVDVATRRGLHPRLKPLIEADAIRVF